MPEKDNIIYIFTDGSCLGNPGPGGFAALLRFNGKEKEITGAEDNTTNNRMEIKAVIEALKSLKTSNYPVIITSDSKYVIDGIEKWIYNWKKDNWAPALKKKVKNLDLWKELEELRQSYSITWKHVYGHQGHTENERVDTLARQAALTLKNQ